MKKKHKGKKSDAVVLANTFKEGSAEEIIKQYDQFKIKAVKNIGLYDNLREILSNPIQHDNQKKKVYEILCEWYDLCQTTISQKTSFKAYSKSELYKIRECMIIAMVEIKELFCEDDESAEKGIKILTVMQDMAWAYCKKEAREKMMEYLKDIVHWVVDNDEECKMYYQKKAESAVTENSRKLEKIVSEEPTRRGFSKGLLWIIVAGVGAFVIIGLLFFIWMSGKKDLEQMSQDSVVEEFVDETGKDHSEEDQSLFEENERLRVKNESLRDANVELLEENERLHETNRELTAKIKELESMLGDAANEHETENITDADVDSETEGEAEAESDTEPGRPFQLVDSRRIRSGKGQSFEKLATVKAGEIVYVLEEADLEGWMKVQYGEIIGYMNPFEGTNNMQ